MPCILAILALLAPRLVIVLLWLFTGWFHGIFPASLWPILGFIFLPTTLLWYSAVQHWYGGQMTFAAVAGVVIAVLIDLSPASGRRRKRDA